MRRLFRTATATGAMALALAAGSIPPAPSAGADPRAGESYRMNVDPAAARERDIPGLAVDPSNPLHVVAADNDLLNGQCDFHASFDGGVTWPNNGHLTAPADFPVPPCQPNPFDSGGYGHTNGSIAFGTGQNVYTTFSSKVGPPQRPENDSVDGQADSILVAKSTDGGRTFGTAVVAARGPNTSQPFYIRPKLAVVPRAAGGDQVYVGFWGVLIPQVPGHGGAQGGLGLRQALTTVSNDGGATYSPPVVASRPPPNDGDTTYGERVRETSTPVGAPGGVAFFAWRNRDPAPDVPKIVVSRTTDGGATWTRVLGTPVLGGGGHPELARDPSSGTLYVTYQNGTLDPNVSQPAPPAAPILTGDTDIYFQRSTDNGTTWSTPLRVNDDPAGGKVAGRGIDQTQPFPTVAPNGRVDVVWHDPRNLYPSFNVSGGTPHDEAYGTTDYYMASSSNGGVSFGANRRVSDRSKNMDVGLEDRVGDSIWYGPASAVMGNDGLLVAMEDSRDGNYDNDNQDVYLSRVAMQPTDLLPVRNLTQSRPASGSVALSRLAYPGGMETQGGVPVSKVVIVNQGDPGLALAASVLARDAWGPLLLSPQPSLPADVKAEVSRIESDPVGGFVIGGTDALSSTVQTDVATAAGVAPGAVERLAGPTPADTAKLIADALDVRSAAQKTAGVAAFPAVVIVNPASPEAGAAAGLAASRRLPVLFVDQSSVPGPTAAALASYHAPRTFVIGGTGAVSNSVTASLPNPTRLSGADVQGTSEAVAAEARAEGSPANVVYVADVGRPADAAVLGAAVARLGGLQVLSTTGDTTSYRSSLQRLGLGSITDRVVVQLPVGVGDGYRLTASDGGIFAFGNLSYLGSMGGVPLARPVVGIAHTPSNNGYWLVASDGGVFAFGDAGFFGSTGNLALQKPIVGMAPTPTGKGYWLVASDGGIFAFGDAAFAGSTGNLSLAKPVVGMTATPTGKGYWLVASDGGIFAFGDAAFKGSMGGIPLAKPIVGMATSPSGAGYWLVASDGGIFAFGDATFFGSTGHLTLAKPIVGMTATPTGRGYRLAASDGGIFSFGDAGFFGSTGGIPLAKPVVGVAS